ncbi:putative peptidoglycan lipid II flippase [Pseudooceanicola antarcticus]|uniref:Probable lipid II flippase MurJ n=1 Tax=Pseudooceanicola antarcticus TaxID=1247613 RepID=A0A285IRM6_9RHOB|nr:murein biosynthesis integral membrane protein MurJ [Pseudooceanicola antarcticus]PJE31870.1 murein biosynthesis integral membrane protein MurJ [Pseudooceanicola antarcticus]SNY50622.1 putative peptidoglycan lipid II flippase [Pseudooceanicola antarcticus]
MNPIRLVSGVFTVGLWTMLSRVLGLARDIILLAALGTGPVYEAFIVAFRLPNMFRRFFAEGAFNMAFVPIFSKKLEARDDPQRFMNEAFAGLATVLILLTLLAQLAMPWLILALASGFAGDEQYPLAVIFGRIAFPYILFISLAALLSGVLNAAGRFAAAAAAPVLLNVLLVGTMLLARPLGLDLGYALIWAVPVAGVAQLALLWRAASLAGFQVRPVRPRLTPDLKRLIRVAIPAALAGGVVQVNLLVGQQVASYFDRAVGWLFTADRLYQLPLGVVGIAIGIVLLPDLSRRLKAEDTAGSRNALSRAGELALALTLPCAVALMVIPLPIVSVLFERGAARPEDSAAIALAVAVYGAGLPAFVLQKVLQPLYFAREDTRRPFNYALLAMVANAVIAIGLAPFIGWIACALATTLAGWVMLAALHFGAGHMGEVARFDPRFRRRAPRILAASLIMGAGLWPARLLLAPWLSADYIRYPALALLIALGSVLYFASGQLIGAFRLTDFTGALRRGRSRET